MIGQKPGAHRGFTLVELLVVVAILAILAAIVVPKYQEATAASRGSRILDDLRTIDSAITIARVKGIENPGQTDLIPDYLASWPAPPTGDAIIEGGSRVSVSSTSYIIISQRATINSKTLEQVLADKSL